MQPRIEMKINLIKGAVASDAQIYIDGVSTHQPNLSEISANIWAGSWDTETNSGEIEFNDGTNNLVPSDQSEFETNIGVTISRIQELATARDAEIQQEETDALNEASGN